MSFSIPVISALANTASYIWASTPPSLTGCLIFGAHKLIQARKIYCQSAEMRQPAEYPYIAHIGGTADVGKEPKDSLSFYCLETLFLKPMGFPKTHICSLSPNSALEVYPKESIRSLSTEQYFTAAQQQVSTFLKNVIKANNKKIDLIITGLSQGGGIAVQLATALLENPEIAAKIDRLLLIPVHATIKGSTANAWPKWMREYLIRFFYLHNACNEFHRDSPFLIKNRIAIETLNQLQKTEEGKILIEYVHDGIDSLVDHRQSKAKNHSWQWDQLFFIGASMLAVSLIFDTPLLLPLLFIAILVGFFNHALGMNNPKIGEHISAFIHGAKED